MWQRHVVTFWAKELTCSGMWQRHVARFGPKSWPFKECDNVTFDVLGQRSDLLRYGTGKHVQKITKHFLQQQRYSMVHAGQSRIGNMSVGAESSDTPIGQSTALAHWLCVKTYALQKLLPIASRVISIRLSMEACKVALVARTALIQRDVCNDPDPCF